MADSLGYSIFLPPDDVVRAWEARGALQPTVSWREMSNGEHAAAFTVAKVAKLDLLRMIRQSLDDVIRSGGTFEQWKADILPELKRQGWWGAVSNAELTGTIDQVIVNERRLRTIYDTNVRMSMASGHWQRIQRQKDVLPYLRYLPSSSEHKRPLHMEWYGVTLPVDHPWWQTHFPPNGWHCKCHYQQVSERMMRKNGWTVTPDDQIPDGPPTRFEWASGQTQMIPAGIDPGFAYNPGTAHLRVVAEKALSSIRSALDTGLDDAAETTLRQIIADPAYDQFLAHPSLVFPVAILTAEQQAVIQARTRVVVLPELVYRKQRGEFPKISDGHAELTTDDYRLLPDIVAKALVVAQQGNNRLVYFTDAVNRLWKAVIRQDADREFPAIVSFHRSRLRSMAAETRNLPILLDRRS